MPLKPGKSKATISSNISEFHKGPTFEKTAKKFGKARANKQAVAVAFSEARRSGKGQDVAVKGKTHMKGCPVKGNVGTGHDCSASMKKVGRGQDYAHDDWERDPTSTDSLTMTRKVAPKPELPKPYEPLVGSGHARKVGKGQAPPPDKMPAKKPRGAMPLPGGKKVSRRHRPPMNRGASARPNGPIAAMGGPPPGLPPMGGGGPPMGGGAPMGPAILPGGGPGGAPGIPGARPPQRLPALPSTGGGWGAKGMPPPVPGMGQGAKKPRNPTKDSGAVKGKKPPKKY